MRILVALIAVFMVSGAVAQLDRDTSDLDLDGNDLRFTDTNAKCQFRSAGVSGPIYACKDPKTGKTQKVECQLSGTNNGDIHAQKMPKQLSGAELQQLCFEDR